MSGPKTNRTTQRVIRSLVAVTAEIPRNLWQSKKARQNLQTALIQRKQYKASGWRAFKAWLCRWY